MRRELAKPGADGSASVFKRDFNVGIKLSITSSRCMSYLHRRAWVCRRVLGVCDWFHRLCNTMERTWVSIAKAQERWRIMLDRAAINAEAGAKESGADRKKQKDQKRERKL